MPEGDTVWRTARSLDRALSGAVLTGSDFRVPALATTDLTGRRVEETLARGKHLLTRVGDLTLHTHLQMEGSWHLYRPGTRWRRPAHEARVVLATSSWQAVGFALGVVEVVPREQEEGTLPPLGPDLLGPDWDEDRAVANLEAAAAVPLHEALLDQRRLAGIGNLYANELCFLVGVNPGTPTGAVPDLRRLVRRAHRVLAANKERVEQTTTGDTRRDRQTWVYRRERQGCLRCGSPVRVEQRGPAGRERATYWCPVCQPVTD